VLREGKYVSVTSDARSIEPNLSDDGRTLLFVRAEASTENDRSMARSRRDPPLHDIVKKDPSGGTESIVRAGS